MDAERLTVMRDWLEGLWRSGQAAGRACDWLAGAGQTAVDGQSEEGSIKPAHRPNMRETARQWERGIFLAM